MLSTQKTIDATMHNNIEEKLLVFGWNFSLDLWTWGHFPGIHKLINCLNHGWSELDPGVRLLTCTPTFLFFCKAYEGQNDFVNYIYQVYCNCIFHFFLLLSTRNKARKGTNTPTHTPTHPYTHSHKEYWSVTSSNVLFLNFSILWPFLSRTWWKTLTQLI